MPCWNPVRRRSDQRHLRSARSPRCLCVPKTRSVLIAWPNRLNVGGDDRALLAPPGPVRLTVQVEERTCGRERCAPTSIDCAAAEGARSRSTHEWGSLILGHAVSMVSIDPQGHHDHPAGDCVYRKLIRIDCVTESPNVTGDDRALLPRPDPVRLAVQ